MRKLEDRGLIAATRNIRNQKVLIYQGKNDEVVRASMAKKLKEFYVRMGVPEGSIQTVYSDGNHNFPTDKSEGIGCDEAKVPYVAKCNLDLAGKILTQTLRRPLQKSAMNEQNLFKVTQDSAPVSIAAYGYLYANK